MTESAASDRAVVDEVIQKPLSFKQSEIKETNKLIRRAVLAEDDFIIYKK
jgi:hypothetical protein